MSGVLLHVGLCVADIDRAERFYSGAFGFERDRDLRMTAAQINSLLQLDPPGDVHSVYLTLDGFTLELMSFDPAPESSAAGRRLNHRGLTHLSIALEDVPAAIDRVVRLGGTLLSHVGRAAILRDPDGQLIELLELAVHHEIEQGRAERRGGRG